MPHDDPGTPGAGGGAEVDQGLPERRPRRASAGRRPSPRRARPSRGIARSGEPGARMVRRSSASVRQGCGGTFIPGPRGARRSRRCASRSCRRSSWGGRDGADDRRSLRFRREATSPRFNPSSVADDPKRLALLGFRGVRRRWKRRNGGIRYTEKGERVRRPANPFRSTHDSVSHHPRRRARNTVRVSTPPDPARASNPNSARLFERL